MPWEDVFASIEPDAAGGGDDRPGAPRDARGRRAGRRQGAAPDAPSATSCATSACSSCSRRRRPARPAFRQLVRPARRWSSTCPARCGASSTSARRRRTSSGCARCWRRTRAWRARRLRRSSRRARLLVMEEVAGRAGPGGARGRDAHGGGARAARVLLPPDPGGGLLPRRPAPREHEVVERQDLPARPRHGRARSTRRCASCCCCCSSRSAQRGRRLPRRGDADALGRASRRADVDLRGLQEDLGALSRGTAASR